MNARQEFLRAYVFQIIGEGVLSNLRSPIAIKQKLFAIIADDLPTVFKDLGQTFFEQGMNFVGSKVASIVDQIARDIGKRGASAVWTDLQKQYQQGTSNLARGVK